MKPSRLTTLASALVDAAAIVTVWVGLFAAENTAIAYLWREQFSGLWEIALARYSVVPMGVVGFAPASLVVVGGWKLAKHAEGGSIAAIRILALGGAVATGSLALGLSNGRHFTNWLLRGLFVGALVIAGAWMAAYLVPRLAAWSRRPLILGAFGLALGVGAWLADAFLLVRLYPALHWALFASTLLAASCVALAARIEALPPGPLANGFAIVVAAAVIYCAASLHHFVAAVDRATNLRIALVEHAPLLGRVVALETWVRSRDLNALSPEGATAAGPSEVPRSLDWSGHDCLLLTVDALRADHVSAYGYARKTTPNVDALASQGALFENAYCPTPHTSYSVTSMMTGKYLRPLLALGRGEDSETWAQYMRLYGWRTAAFYPPAVFFIDGNRFLRLAQTHLGFEYAKVEFADPALREKQVAEYLSTAPPDRPLFLWVHFFEPHEPYVTHPEHVFSGGAAPDVDAYDGEIAAADEGVGRIVRLMRERRPGAVVLVTADHGEEFGEHGGRYHGTTVYEEQVRVPVVVVAPGVRPGDRIQTVVQTIDLLPTTLSALGIPRPARLRGRDLGPVLARAADSAEAGFAFAETDDYSLVASGTDRLVCQRRAAACALYRPKEDPAEQHDVTPLDPGRAAQLHARLRSVELDHGRYEASGGPVWPEALRRGLQGESDSAPEVASLLDDADVGIRRKAAEVCFELHAKQTVPAVRRAFTRDEDGEVRRWSALALTRMGEPAPLTDTLLYDARSDWRHAAALALGERGDAKACEELTAWWNEVVPPRSVGGPDAEPAQLSIDLTHAEELLSATVSAHCKSAVLELLRALKDVRARPHVADALGALGDNRACGPLLALLTDEPYVTTRPHEAHALRALGCIVRPAESKPFGLQRVADEVDRPLSRK